MNEIIKLFDENLIGQPGLSRYIHPGVDWTRNTEEYDIAIYVDRMCFTSKIREDKQNYAWIVEPSIINGDNYNNVVKSKNNFKNIFTHSTDMLNRAENAVYVPHGGTWLREEDINLHEKSKMTSFIFSCKQWNSYHKMRFRVYEAIKHNKVDFYGTGPEKPIDFKIKGLKDYRFSIVIENNDDGDYFSEKLLDCFLSGTVPIYLGIKNIGKFFDSNGMFFFTEPEHVAQILDTLTPELYLSKIDSVKANFELAKKYMFPEKIIQTYINNKNA